MSFRRLRKLGYVMLIGKGLLSLLAPRKALVLVTTGWRLGFENVSDLEPRAWTVETMRVTGVGLLASGLAGLLLLSRQSDDDGGIDTPDDSAPSDDEGPVQVNVD